MANYQIYAHINKINHKIYIGLTSAKNPNNRWHGGCGYQRNDKFYSEIKQYGWENFEHLILETDISESQVDEREKYWIAYYNATDPEKGYNKLSGGRHGGQMSEEGKQKVRDSWTEERRKAKSDEMKLRWTQNGEQLRQEKRELMIHLNKTLDRSGDNNSKSNLGKFGAEAHRAKKVICEQTGEVFGSIIDAAKWANNGKTTIKAHISAVCKGTRKHAGKHPVTQEPLSWQYYEKKEIE